MKTLKYVSTLAVIWSLSNHSVVYGYQFNDGEKRQIDSLGAIISDPNSHDTLVVQANTLLADVLYPSNRDTVVYMSEQTIKMIDKSLKSKPSDVVRESLLSAKAGSYSNLGIYFYRHGDVPKSLDYFKKGVETLKSTSDKKGIASSFSNIGVIHYQQGDIPKALDYYSESLKIREEIGDKMGISDCLNNLGYAYQHQEDTEKALEYYQRSLKLREEIGYKKGIGASLNNIGLLYLYETNEKLDNKISTADKSADIAIEYFNRSLAIREEINDEHGIGNSLHNLGVMHWIKAKAEKHKGADKTQIDAILNQCLEFHFKALKLRENSGNHVALSISSQQIAKTLLDLGRLPEAKKYIQQAMEIAQEGGFPDDIRAVAETATIVYERDGDHAKALEMYILYISMKDSISNEKNIKAIAKQQSKYEYEKKKALDDAEHEKQLAIEQEEKEKQQILTYSAGGGLVLVLFFLWFAFDRLKVTKRQKAEIEEKNENLEEANIEITFQKEVIEEKNHDIMGSIHYAKRIQEAILPPNKVIKEYIPESLVLYKPKDIVSGDFYWMEPTEGKVLFAAVDCTGHGVPGAFVSIVGHNGLNRAVKEFGLTNPADVLDKLNELVDETFSKQEIGTVKDGMDIALCSLDIDNMKLEYAGANNPLYIIRKGELIETKADKQPVGSFDFRKPFNNHEFDLQAGDTIYIFSDGFADQFGGPKGKKFKYSKFKELLVNIQTKDMEEQREVLDNTIETWKGELEQIDDVCIIGVRV